MKLAHPTEADIGKRVLFATENHGMRCEVLTGISGGRCDFDNIRNEKPRTQSGPGSGAWVLMRPMVEVCYVFPDSEFVPHQPNAVPLADVRDVIKALRRKASGVRGLSKMARVTDTHRVQLLGEIAGYVGAADIVRKLDPFEDP